MKNQFATYTRTHIAEMGEQYQNVVFELMARCINDGTRIIIEQGDTDGDKYLLVDFSPTDNSNTEFIAENGYACFVSGVEDNNIGTCKDFANYSDAYLWLVNFLKFEDYSKIYIESY